MDHCGGDGRGGAGADGRSIRGVGAPRISLFGRCGVGVMGRPGGGATLGARGGIGRFTFGAGATGEGGGVLQPRCSTTALGVPSRSGLFVNGTRAVTCAGVSGPLT